MAESKGKGKWVAVAATTMHDIVIPIQVAQDADRELRVRYEERANYPRRIVVEMFVPKKERANG